MELLPTKSWKLEFARSAEPERHREIVRRVQEEAKKREREQDQEEREDDLLDVAEMVVMATEAQIADFTVTVDHYETATYEALIENEQALDDQRRALREMLDRAYQLPDGTRVFETEDGLRVFNEHGVEITEDVLSPDEIDDRLPKWEAFRDGKAAELSLVEERAALIRYQQELDDARELLKTGEISEEDLEELKAKLADEMPDSVRDHLPEEYQPKPEADPQPDEKPDQVSSLRPTGNLDMPSL